jgi:hypothetical protein
VVARRVGFIARGQSLVVEGVVFRLGSSSREITLDDALGLLRQRGTYVDYDLPLLIHNVLDPGDSKFV